MLINGKHVIAIGHEMGGVLKLGARFSGAAIILRRVEEMVEADPADMLSKVHNSSRLLLVSINREAIQSLPAASTALSRLLDYLAAEYPGVQVEVSSADEYR